MKAQEPVSRIMTSKVVTAQLSSSLDKVEKLMNKHHIRHIPIVSKGKLVGILSLTDLKRMSFTDTFGESEVEVDTAIYNMLSIDQVMVSNPRTVDSETPIREVAEMLAHSEFHALPVTHDGNLVGIVTTTDLIRYFLDQL